MVTVVDPLTRLAYGARAGDAAALEALVEAGYGQVWQLCGSLVDAQSADDLAQETFIRAVRTLPKFRGDATARTWLLAIARHVCTDELRTRSRRRRRDASLVAGATANERTAPDAGEMIGVADLVRRLDPDRRAAFVLTQMLGLSYEETARVCECPVGTIRSRVARARSDLLALLADARLPQRAPHRGTSSS
jgi:RNA polymerase sigma-70 factor (ECF subfamily)